MSERAGEPRSDTDVQAHDDAALWGYCNSCGEEMQEGDECCEDGEWMPYDD